MVNIRTYRELVKKNLRNKYFFVFIEFGLKRKELVSHIPEGWRVILRGETQDSFLRPSLVIGYRPIMFSQAARKVVGPIIFGYKI